MRYEQVQIAAADETISLIGARVSRDIFALAGVQPILGRTFLER
jgi:hypothetical protein